MAAESGLLRRYTGRWVTPHITMFRINAAPSSSGVARLSRTYQLLKMKTPTSFETSGHVKLPATQQNIPEGWRILKIMDVGTSEVKQNSLSSFLTISRSGYGTANIKRVCGT